jgi:hypothetical protein
MEEETTNSLIAEDIGAPITLGSFAPTDQKRRKQQYIYRLLIGNNAT